MEIDAPFIASKAEPGQFIILRVDEDGERIPLTVAGYDRDAGWVRIIYQIVGATTKKLDRPERRAIIWQDFVGPLGVPTHIEGLKKVCMCRRRRRLRHCAVRSRKKLHAQGC